MIRSAKSDDMSQITILRTSVLENHMSVHDLAARGITEQGIWDNIEAGFLGAWVAQWPNKVVAFAMADKRNGNIFALFTQPACEGKGFGSVLLEKCEIWLVDNGWKEANLDTNRKSKAYAFYLKRGWVEVSDKQGNPSSAIMRKTLQR